MHRDKAMGRILHSQFQISPAQHTNSPRKSETVIKIRVNQTLMIAEGKLFHHNCSTLSKEKGVSKMKKIPQKSDNNEYTVSRQNEQVQMGKSKN